MSSSGPTKRTKYSSVSQKEETPLKTLTMQAKEAGIEDIDEQTVNEVLNKTKMPVRMRHAFDKVEDSM